MKSPARCLPSLAILLFAVLVFPGTALSQDPPRPAQLVAQPASTTLCVDDPRAHAVEDVRARVAQMRIADGATTVGRTSTGLRLVAFAEGGRVLDYAVVDEEGRTATTQSVLAVSATGDDCNPCCWKCGKDGGGTVHCWQIECPVIVSNMQGRD